jgi:TIR domain
MPKSPIKPAPERKIFVSYSHKDYDDVKQFLMWLHVLCDRLPGTNSAWVDYEQLRGGDTWNPKIDQALAEANIFIVVMSIDYAASDFCKPNELKPILAKRERGQAQVIGILLHELKLANFDVTLDEGNRVGLKDFQCLPQSGQTAEGVRRLGLRPIQSWPNENGRREAWNLVDSQLELALIGTHADAGLNSTPMPMPMPMPMPGAAAPAFRSAPAAPAGGDAGARLAAQWLPYLANRGDQCTALNGDLTRWKQTDFKRPLVILTEGRSEDCLHKWMDRLQAHELELTLKLEAEGLSFGDSKSIAWPTAARTLASLQAAQQEFESAMAYALWPGALAGFTESALAFFSRQRPTMLWLSCQDHTDSGHSLRALGGLLQLLGKLPTLTKGNMVIVALNLERAAGAAPGQRARLASEFEDALLQAQAAGAIQVAALGSLPELNETDVQRWATSHAKTRLKPDLYIDDLCGDLPQSPTRHWSMRAFAVSARQWFAKP